MLSKSIRVALFLVVAASSFWGLSATKAQAAHPASLPIEDVSALNTTDVIYTQPIDPSGTLFLSSWLSPDGSDFDQNIWDNFTLPADQTITDIEWFGGYKSGAGGPALDFTVAIYPSIAAGTEPAVAGPPLVQYQTGGNAGETSIGPVGATNPMYAYAFSLPAPFAASAGVKYWVHIVATQDVSTPTWGIAAGTGGNVSHYRWGAGSGGDSGYRTVPGDAAFTLLGPAVPIGNLSATNDSPTELGQTTTFTATVSAGSGIVYTWDFGDQATDSGQVVTHMYTATGSYTGVVTATNSLGSATATTVVTITDAPVAGLTAINSSPTPLGNVTSLTATIASGSNVSYQWNLGNDVMRQGRSVTFTYAAAGFYTAVVTASNSVSLLTATTPITIYTPKYIYLPLILKSIQIADLIDARLSR